MIEVRKYSDDYIAGDEGWRRVTGKEDVLGVWALRYDDAAPWIWDIGVGIVTGVPHLAPSAGDIERVLRSVSGVAGVRQTQPDSWEVRGDPSGEALVRAVAELVDAAVADAQARPDPTKAAAKLIVQGLRSRGYRGRSPKLNRTRSTGSLEVIVVNGRWQRSTVSLDLSFVPAALLQVWKELDHWMLAHFDGGAVNVGFFANVGHLDGIRDGEYRVDRSSPERTAAEVLDRFDSLGADWYDLFREGDDAVETTSLPERIANRFSEDFFSEHDLVPLAAHLLSGPRDPAKTAQVIEDLRAEAGRLGGFSGRGGFDQDIAVIERLAELLVASDPDTSDRRD